MTQIQIPASIEEAKTALDGVGALLTAKEWERAAIVYAFTEPKQGQRNLSGSPEKLSLAAFADLKITGLSNKDTVAEYRKAWQSAMDDGAPEAKPGESITMPNLPWPPGFIDHRRGTHATTAEVEAAVAKKIAEEPGKVIEQMIETGSFSDALMDQSSLAREAVVEAIADTSVADEIAAATAEKRHREPRGHQDINLDRVLQIVKDALDDFWDRDVQVGPDRRTYRQIVETVKANRGSRSLRSRVVPTADLGEELLASLTAHIEKSIAIRDTTNTLATTAAALVEAE